MQSYAATPALQTQDEDPLAYLPYSTIIDYARGTKIYTHDKCATALYLVVKGRVKLSRLAGKYRHIVIDVYQTGDLFGESAFLDLPYGCEEAVALDDAKLMHWPMPVLRENIMKRPPLAIALLQLLTKRTIDFKQRIESLSTDPVERRLARSLCRFSDRLGTSHEDGAVHLAPLTHELLAQCTGTSREVVSYYMSLFRRQGFVNYSRKALIVYTEALRQRLSLQS